MKSKGSWLLILGLIVIATLLGIVFPKSGKIIDDSYLIMVCITIPALGLILVKDCMYTTTSQLFLQKKLEKIGLDNIQHDKSYDIECKN